MQTTVTQITNAAAAIITMTTNTANKWLFSYYNAHPYTYIVVSLTVAYNIDNSYSLHRMINYYNCLHNLHS